MKYWAISYSITKGRHTALVAAAYYVVLFLNFAIPAFVSAMGVLYEKIFD